jgi:hypothetical protein
MEVGYPVWVLVQQWYGAQRMDDTVEEARIVSIGDKFIALLINGRIDFWERDEVYLTSIGACAAKSRFVKGRND